MGPCSTLGYFSNWGPLVGWDPGASCPLFPSSSVALHVYTDSNTSATSMYVPEFLTVTANQNAIFYTVLLCDYFILFNKNLNYNKIINSIFSINLQFSYFFPKSVFSIKFLFLKIQFAHTINNKYSRLFWLSIYVSVTKATARAVRGS